MQSAAIIGPRYIRTETLAEVYDTDERGPGIEPIEVIKRSIWLHADTGLPVTDEAELARLEREYPATI